MYIKITKNLYKDNVTEHAKIVESYRDGKTSRQKVLLNLGTIHSIKDRERFYKILSSMKRGKYFVDIEDLSVNSTKEFGVSYVTNHLLNKYDIEQILKKHLNHNDAKFDVYEVIKALIVNRVLDPSSELSAADWINKHYSEDLTVSEHHLYRSLDYLIPNKEKIEEEIFKVLKQKLNLNTTQTFYDLTSSYFEGDKCKIALFGYSRDHRKDRKQIVLGLAMCDGIPILHEVHKGNTVDKKTLESMQINLNKRLGINNTTFLGDAGLMTEENISNLESNNYGYIFGCYRRNNKYAEKYLIQEINTKENQYAKEAYKEEIIVNGESKFRRLILCIDKDTKKKRLDDLDRIKEKIELKLKELNEKYKKSRKRKKGKKITKESLIIQANQILGKNKRIFSLNFSCGLKYSIKKKKWSYERNIAGKFLLITNTNIDPNKAMKEYKQLQDVENAFDELKNFLGVRPIYHWKTRRVKAHIFVCVLAYLIECLIEKFTKKTARKVVSELKTIKVVDVEAKNMRKKLISKISDDSNEILKELMIPLPFLLGK